MEANEIFDPRFSTAVEGPQGARTSAHSVLPPHDAAERPDSEE